MKAIIAVPITLVMVYRAWSHRSLTPAGIATASLTAAAHAAHPWCLPYALLIIFFLAGSQVTKFKHNMKAKLVVNASGNSGGEGARTHIQVLANSGVASVLTLMHAYQLRKREHSFLESSECYLWRRDLLVVGIIANYAAVAADTFSSELGILSKSQPRLITTWNLRKVPPGTNGGVTFGGLAASFLGSLVIATTSMAMMPFCQLSLLHTGQAGIDDWNFKDRQLFALAITLWGALGSVLDSFLGGLLQQSIVDTKSGRIVEGNGGKKVLFSGSGPNSLHSLNRAETVKLLSEGEETQTQSDQTHKELNENTSDICEYDTRKKLRTSSIVNKKPSRIIESGHIGLLDNNEVNFLMALTMSLSAMGIASWTWGIPISSVLSY